MGKFIDLTGQKFGRLTVIKRAENQNSHTRWVCDCECGNSVIAKGIHLKSGHTQSCGCAKIELHTKRLTKHGYCGTSLYNVWCSMKERCCNKQAQRYNDYGGRGIKVCSRWLNSFEAFYEDVSKLPHFGEKGYSLDRINNDGNYEPSNIRWATAKEQANNKRKRTS